MCTHPVHEACLTDTQLFVVNCRHPVHIHVNPIQVQEDQDDWNQPGDWMDVVMSDGIYRQHLADHAGTVIVHCHWLSHEDLGCMNQFTIEECPEDDIANGAHFLLVLTKRLAMHSVVQAFEDNYMPSNFSSITVRTTTLASHRCGGPVFYRRITQRAHNFSKRAWN